MLQFIAFLLEKFFRAPFLIFEFFKDMANLVISERIVKRILFLFLLIVLGADGNNEATIKTRCSNSTIQVNITFSNPFKGIVYTEGNFFNALCSQSAHPNSTTEMSLDLPLHACMHRIEEAAPGVRVSSAIFIQHHYLIKTTFDSTQNISCELPLSLNSLQLSGHGNVTKAVPSRPRMVVWLDLKVGTDLFHDGETRDEDIESSLYIVIKLADRYVHHDLVVRSCIAHDEMVISDETMLYQMTDTYGCSDSSMLSNFTVTNQTEGFSNIMAYAMIQNITMFAKGQLYMTCGLSLCRTTCQNRCGEDEQGKPSITHIVAKKIVKRAPEVTTPDSLRIFEDGAHAIQKRSVPDNVFGVSSRIILGVRRTISTEEFVLTLPSKENKTISEFSFDTSGPPNNESVDLLEQSVTPDLGNVSRASEVSSHFNVQSNFQVKSTEVSTLPYFYMDQTENDSALLDTVRQIQMQSPISGFEGLLPTSEESILQHQTPLATLNSECLSLNISTDECSNSSYSSLNTTAEDFHNTGGFLSRYHLVVQCLIIYCLAGVAFTIFLCITCGILNCVAKYRVRYYRI